LRLLVGDDWATDSKVISFSEECGTMERLSETEGTGDGTGESEAGFKNVAMLQ